MHRKLFSLFGKLLQQQYVDLGFSKRIALWEFFSDQFGDNFTKGDTAVNALHHLQYIPNIDNTIVLNLIILTLIGNEEYSLMSFCSWFTTFATLELIQNSANFTEIQ